MTTFDAQFNPGQSAIAGDRFPVVIPAPDVDITHEDIAVDQSSSRDNARKVHAAVYLREGYVGPEDIDENGFLSESVDPYVEQSTYFYSESPERKVSARQIHPEGKEGILSLPALKYFSCDPEVVKDVAGVEKLVDLKPSEVVEISAVAAINGKPSDGRNLGLVIETYVQMLKSSVEENHKLWVMGTDRRLTRRLTGLLGEDLFHRMGERKDYMGSPTDPMVLNPQAVVREFLTSEDPAKEPYKQVIKEGLSGIDTTLVSDDMKAVLEEAEVETTEGSKFRALWEKRKPEAIAFASLVGYTALRAAPMGQIEEFHGDPMIFFGIDAGTALPYTAGMSWMLRAKNSAARKVTGAAVAGSSFAAPYVYLWANGENYPGYVNGAIGGFVAFGVAKEAIGNKLRNRKEQRLAEGIRTETQ